MKKLFLLIPLFLLSCVTTKNYNSYSMDLGPKYDSIAVYRYNKIYMPKIAIDGAKVIHFHEILVGRYKVELYSNGSIETRKFKLK